MAPFERTICAKMLAFFTKSNPETFYQYNFELLCCKNLHVVYIVKKEEGNEYKPETFKIVFTTGVN